MIDYMNPCIHRIETLLPPNSAPQAELATRLGAWSRDPAVARLIRHIFQKSGIDRRHSVLADFTGSAEPELFHMDATGGVAEPSTQERNRCYAKYAGAMATGLGRRILDGTAGFTAKDVTHVITVSCTGFVNPGPDYQVVSQLGMSGTVQRYNLGFMGCYAALPALRLAQQLCMANPEAVVLVICIELCSLHMQIQPTPDSILANALFSDGAAAVLVSSKVPQPDSRALSLDCFNSAIAAEGVRDMAWEVGNHGFNLVLSSYVPDVIAMNIERITGDLMRAGRMDISDISYWAIHPGGRAILDKVQSALVLEPWQIQPSRDVLRNCGNMSSVTILFVLERILAEAGADSSAVAAMAFGPGLTIETALLRVLPARSMVVDPTVQTERLQLCS